MPNSGGISPLSSFRKMVQPFQVGEVAQLRRYFPAQLVLAEFQPFSGRRDCPTPGVSPRSTGSREGYSPSRLARLPNSERYLPAQLVVVEAKCMITLPVLSVLLSKTPWKTPCHSFNGASLSQFVLSLQFGPSVGGRGRPALLFQTKIAPAKAWPWAHRIPGRTADRPSRHKSYPTGLADR